MIKNNSYPRFISLIICFLFILNLALFFKIPILLQSIGIIALCFVPGYLIGLISRIRVSDLYENFFYSIGLSIIFDLFFGLGINTVLPLLGERTPLSPLNLQIGYSLIILVLTLLILSTENVPEITLPHICLHRKEKLLLIFGLAILVSVETGTYMLNMGFSNLVLIFSLLTIPVLLFFCIIYHDDTLKRSYPFIIYLISVSLVLTLSLRSDYILGVDTNYEYYLFFSTLTHAIWVPDPSLLLSSSLSISLLPTVFENFLFVDPQLLFKILYPFLFSFTPVIIYIIVKKYFSELLAIFAAFFFMVQAFFVYSTSEARTCMAIFFIILFLMCMCDEELTYAKKYALLLLFVAGVIFSHYTSSFILLFIVITAYVIESVISRRENRKENRLLTLPFIIFFISLIFFWYQQVINIVFSSGLQFTLARNDIFINLLKSDIVHNSATQQVINHTFSISISTILNSFIDKLIAYSQLPLYLFMGLGILIALYIWISKKIPPAFNLEKFSKVNPLIISMAIVSLGLLFCAIIYPSIFNGYDIDRLIPLLLPILSIFLISGISYAFLTLVMLEKIPHVLHNIIHKYRKFLLANQPKILAGILLFLLIPAFLLVTNISNQIEGGPYSIALNSPLFSSVQEPIFTFPQKYSYIYSQDATALQWFRDHSNQNARIYSDYFGENKITTFVARPALLYEPSILEIYNINLFNSYIYFSYTNEYFNHLRNDEAQEFNISLYNKMLSQKNKIFVNGADIYL
jgi:uncharacterized membrane protein